MNELARAIFSFLPPLPPPFAPESPLSLPPPQATSATAKMTATPGAPILRPLMRIRIPPFPARVRQGEPGHGHRTQIRQELIPPPSPPRGGSQPKGDPPSNGWA